MTVSSQYREPPLSPPSGHGREATLAAREFDVAAREAAIARARQTSSSASASSTG